MARKSFDPRWTRRVSSLRSHLACAPINCDGGRCDEH